MSEDLISGSLQENILILLCFNDHATPLLIHSVDPGLFESDVYKDVAKQAIDYYNQFKCTPKEHIADLLEDKLDDENPRRANLYKQILISLYNAKDQVNEKYVISQVQKFIRQQRLKTSIVDAARYVRDGDVDAAQLTLEKSLRTTIDVFQPGVLFRDPNQSLRFFDETTQSYKIGVKPLDNMGFGPAPGELFVILAPANRGKCIAEDARITMADGTIRSIKEVVENKLDGILSLDQSTGRLIKTKISDHYDNGIKECLEVKTRTGRKVKVTPEHPFLTPKGWLPITELKAGDYVAVPRQFAPYVSDDIMWDKVMHIKGTDPVHTYDLTVDTHHNFIANDMIVHNTWGMVHIGKMAVIQRLKVLHISLEMSEEKMSQRYVQSFFSLGKRQGQAQIINFRQDELGRLTGLELDTSLVRPTLVDSGIEKVVRRKMENIRGDFYIKRFPTNALTIRGLEAYLDSMERYYNFVPDLLLVDYADLFKLDTTNLRIATGEVYKELRRVAVERNMAVVTASQSNRLGEDARILSLKYLGEDYSKAATSDNIMAYCQTSAELRFGLARLFIAKARDEEREQTVLISQAYKIGQFCMNAVQMHDRYWDELNILHNSPAGTEQGGSDEEGPSSARRSLPRRRYS